MNKEEPALSIAKGWMEAWNRNDLEAVLEYLSVDFVCISPRVEDSAVNRADSEHFWRGHFPWDTGFRFDGVEYFASGDKVAVTYVGPLSKLPHIDILTIENGKVVAKDIYMKVRGA